MERKPVTERMPKVASRGGSQRLQTVRLTLPLVILCVCLWAAACNRSKTFSVELTQAELQQRLDAQFPVEEERFLSKVTLAEPRVLLEPGRDDIGVEFKLTIDPPLLEPQTGRVAARGKLFYNKGEKAFYLKNPEVRSLQIEGVESDQLLLVQKPVEAVAQAALEVFPVFKFKGRDLEEVTAEHILEKVTVHNGKVVAELGLP